MAMQSTEAQLFADRLDGFGWRLHQIEDTVNAILRDLSRLITQGQTLTTVVDVPTGVILDWPTDTPPDSWLLCDGSAVSRTTYAALFGVIGTTYGAGDGSTTFNVPDYRGRVPVGKDSSQTEFDALAETGGVKTHTLVTGEIPAHGHAVGTLAVDSQGAHTHTQDRATTHGDGTARFSGTDDASSGSNSSSSQGAHTHTISGSSANAGGGGAHQNLQPYLVANRIIRT